MTDAELQKLKHEIRYHVSQAWHAAISASDGQTACDRIMLWNMAEEIFDEHAKDAYFHGREATDEVMKRIFPQDEE